MTRIYVFPGQGSQRKGMGKALFDAYADEIAQFEEELGYSLERLCLEDPDGVLGQTEYTQPALYLINALSYRHHLEQGGAPADFLAGHSLGEFSALFAAGAFDLITGLRIVQHRGRLMSRAPRGAMAAVLGMDEAKIATLLADAGFEQLDIANRNSPTQTIISGPVEQVAASEAIFTQSGARFFRLNVSAAFHSRLMASVEREFGKFLDAIDLQPLTTDVVANYTARPYPRSGYADYLIKQITHPVRWLDSVEWLLRQPQPKFQELGPGQVLTRLIAEIEQSPRPVARRQPAPVAGSDGLFATGAQSVRGNQPCFMYAGQGSQYYQMGRQLYEEDSVFRDWLGRCSDLAETISGVRLIAELYHHHSKLDDMDDVRVSHPALFSVGYALTKTLIHRGIRPSAVVGYSLGEYVAATVAGVITLEDGLRLVTKQAEYLHRQCSGGAMLTVLTDVGDYETNAPDYEGVTLACVNYRQNFVLSGDRELLSAIQSKLEARSIVSAFLPVRQGFHSPAVESIEAEFNSLLGEIPICRATVPIYSCAQGNAVDQYSRQHFWDAIRRKTQFQDLIARLGNRAQTTFVDLSPTATLAAFINRGFDEPMRSHFAINQYGRDVATVSKLVRDLRPQAVH